MNMDQPRLIPLALMVSMSLLAGCASQRTAFERPDVRVPASWQQASAAAGTTAQPDAQSADRWWTRFGDAQLDKLVAEALQRNGDLAQAAIKVRKAQLKAGLAASDQLPTVSVSASSSNSRRLSGGSTTRTNTAAAEVSWELDLWGRLAALRDVADWEAQATEEDRQAAGLSLVGTVTDLYWQIAYLNQRIVASEESIAYARKTLELVQAQHRAGSASGLEEAEATQTLTSQLASHTQLIQQRVEARNALAILFDGPPGAAFPELARLPDAGLPAVEAGLPASLLTRRPDLKAAELRLRENVATVDATRVGYYPTLTLTGSVGGSSSALSDVLAHPIGTLGAGLVLPFVQWRDMQRNVAVSQADADVAIVAFRQTWYQALADVENALSARQQYDAQAEQLEIALAAARKVERLYEVQYRAGAIPLKIWLDGQESRRTAENSLAENRLNRLNNAVTLYQALGGDMLSPSAQ